jgi:hypothetical protein
MLQNQNLLNFLIFKKLILTEDIFMYARRLGIMELILLLMGKKFSRCSIAVDFLPTSPPGFQLKAVKPAWMILE